MLDPDGAADVVDQHVDAAEALDGKRHQLPCAFERAEVDNGGCSVDAVLPQLADGLLGCRFDAVCHYDLSALLPQALRRSASDALSRSGHDADLVPQPSGTCRPRIELVGHLPEFLRVTLLLRRTFGVGPHV